VQVISAQDVAIYGGLCALATFDRSELKKRVSTARELDCERGRVGHAREESVEEMTYLNA
jgi:hypothetical protein